MPAYALFPAPPLSEKVAVLFLLFLYLYPIIT
jgi:hypothetical protein